MDKLKFSDLNLSREMQRAIEDIGFEEASPIQSRAIPHVIEGRDVIGQAQTGTGKTAAFGIPILEMVAPENKKLQALVLCPTRELAVQVSEEFIRLSKYKRGINILPVYGGQPIDRQIQALKKGVQIVIGTPGRVMDHMKRRTLKTETVRMVVLDEADEMLDMGFIEDIENILKDTPSDRQTVLFSATMPQDILNLTKKYQKDPEYIKVVHKELTVPNIEQVYFEVKEKMKSEILSRLIDMYNPKLSLVFCNTKRKVDELTGQLQARGYSVEGLHGDMKQSQRDRVMDRFRKGVVDILVATDVAARGIDVDDVEAVFNYDVPQDEEYYVHRIGRTARAGRTGRALTLVVGREVYKLRDIQRYTKTKIALHEVPSVGDIEEIKINAFLDRVKQTIDEEHLTKYSAWVESLISQDYTSLDIASALLKMAVGKDDEAEIEEEFADTGAEPGMVRLFINAGRSNKISPKDVVGAIAGEAGIPGKVIGTIDVYDKFTFVEVPKEYANDVLSAMKNNKIKGKTINIEPAGPRQAH
jgi:Superfamily II DNA and RNA helicases